mmetsp:Transcript_39531/g.84406  ORF Transcript_39531/g.84406 Transcript_39531/m.84406 type:complete len:116 (-) Transcript_39531:120-467(-)
MVNLRSLPLTWKARRGASTSTNSRSSSSSSNSPTANSSSSSNSDINNSNSNSEIEDSDCRRCSVFFLPPSTTEITRLIRFFPGLASRRGCYTWCYFEVEDINKISLSKKRLRSDA